MRLASAIAIVLEHAAAADDALDVRLHRNAAITDPLLELDPVFRTRLELSAEEHRQRAVIPIGARAAAVLEGAHWENDRDGALGAIDLTARGWRTGIRIAYDLGFATLELHGEVDHVDTGYGAGTYRDIGASIGRTFKLSRWMTAWIALSIARRQWDGQPPLGQAKDETTLMLTIGSTFR